MVRNKKRPQYVIDMVNDINAYLRFKNVKDESDTLFCWLRNYLLDKDIIKATIIINGVIR